jgi:NADH dehydrogenase FAD-containing subunit
LEFIKKMGSLKALIIGIGPSQKTSSTPNIFANIVLMDKSQNIQPILYELHSDSLRTNDLNSLTETPSFFHLPKGNFLFIGEVEEIDKKRKVIRLVSGGTVTYKHLLTAKGVRSFSNENQNTEFGIAFKLLIDSLKIQKMKPFMQDNLFAREIKRQPQQASHNPGAESSSSLVKVVRDRITPVTSHSMRDLFTTYERKIEINI